ncbi:MAG: hypothetical protein KIT73_10135 [Burkholderiales bacterium]|nr:hypothetical protein [Burkholderiales bacterium]
MIAPTARIPAAALAAFTAGGVVYRAFGCAIAAGCGSLLIVPKQCLASRLDELAHGCPVPFEEVLATLETPVTRAVDRYAECRPYAVVLARLSRLGLADWDVAPFRVPRAESTGMLFAHHTGVRYALTAERMFRAAA